MSAGPPVAGWREWVALPELSIQALEAKLDTGTRTSVLHAVEIETFEDGGRARVCFRVHPVRKDEQTEVRACADVVDERIVVSSNGQEERRIVIRTPMTIGGWTWPVEITLTDRRRMQYRMLLGREALAGRLVVDPIQTHLHGRPEEMRG